jgi:hypothetical protein
MYRTGDIIEIGMSWARCLRQGGAGGEAISMGFGCLPEDAPAVLAMFSDVVQSPALPLQRIELYKAQVNTHKNTLSSAPKTRFEINQLRQTNHLQ